MKECVVKAYSNDYADYISSASVSERILDEKYNIECIQNIANRYFVGYMPRVTSSFSTDTTVVSIPRLFVMMQDGALQSTQVLKVRDNPFFELYGRGVLVGFVDTGID